MLSEKFSQEIIQRFFLKPGDTITQIQTSNHGVIVKAEDWWQIETVTNWFNFTKSDEYKLYEITLYIFSDPPPIPHGVALLPNGSLYYLNQENEFRQFFRQFAHQLPVAELAGLLSRYQGNQAMPGARHSLILQVTDLEKILESDQIATIPDLVSLHSFQIDETCWLKFCTYCLVAEPPQYTYHINVHYWQVKSNHQGELEWSVRVIAHSLDSLWYSRKG
jgi:hypothetical protein